MSSPIVVKFSDFKSLAKDKRIYYYVGDDFYEFNFISDGIIVKSSIMKSEIEDVKRFFSEPMFYNTMELKFRIPNPKSNIDDVGEAVNNIAIDEIQDEEIKNEDVQREGVQE